MTGSVARLAGDGIGADSLTWAADLPQERLQWHIPMAAVNYAIGGHNGWIRDSQ